MPYWSHSATNRSVQDTSGPLLRGYSHFSVACYWPLLRDEYGRRGLFFWICRVYPPTSEDSKQRDLEATIAIVRQASDWLTVPLQILATSGGDARVVLDHLSSRIQAFEAPLPEPLLADGDDFRTRLPSTAAFNDGSLAAVAASDERHVGNHRGRAYWTPRTWPSSTVRLIIILAIGGVVSAGVWLFWPAPAPHRETVRPRIRRFATTHGSIQVPVKHEHAEGSGALVPPSFFASYKMIVGADGLHIRSSPNIASVTVGTVYAGDHVTVVGRVEGWKQVTTDSGLSGWVVESFLASAE